MAQSVLMQLLLEIKQYKQSLQQATVAFKTATDKLTAQAARGSKAMGRTTRSASKFGNAIEFIKKRIIAAGLFFAAFYQGLILFRQFVGDVIGELFKLDEGLRRIQSITKDTDETIDKLRGRLLRATQAGETFGQKASEIADAMFDIVQSGFSVGEAFEIAKVAALGASAGFTSADVAGRAVVAVMNALGRPAEEAREIMDVLFKTVDVGVITFEELANSLGRALGPAAALGVDLEELGAIISVLTRRGLKGREAITSMTRIMFGFLKPSAKAAAAAREYGIELSADTIAANGLVGSLIMMDDKLGGNSEAWARVFDRQRAVIGAQLLMADGGAELIELFDEMGLATDGAGAAMLAQNERAKALTFQFKQLGVQLIALTTRGLEPVRKALMFIVPIFSDLVAGKGPLIGFFKDNTEVARGLAAALIFLAIRAIAPMVVAMGQSLVAALARARAAMMGMVAANPVILAIAIAIGALVVGLGFLSRVVDNSDAAIARLDDRMQKWRDRVVKLAELRDIFGQAFFDEELANDSAKAISDMTTQALADIERFRDDARKALLTFGDFGREAGRAIARGWRLITSGDLRSDMKLTSDALREDFEEMITNSDQTEESLRDLSQQLIDLQNAAREEGLFELNNIFQKMAFRAQETADAIAAQEEADLAVLEVKGLISRMVESIVGQLDTVLNRVKTWERGLKKVRDVINAIMDLTTLEQQTLTVAMAELDVAIADRGRQIADIEFLIAQRAAEIGKSVGDIEEGENAIIDRLMEQIKSLERGLELINAERDIIQAEVELIGARNDLIGESIELEALVIDVAQGLGLEFESQRDTALEVVRKLLEGVDATKEWVENTEGLAARLEDPVLSLIEDIVDQMDQEFGIDVSAALAALRSVRGEINSLPNLQELRAQFPTVAPGRLRAEAGFQHGVRNFMGGLALVGETGPELLRLPRGADVIPGGMIGPAMRDARQQPTALTANAEVNITTSLLKDFRELKEAVLRAVDEQLDNAAARTGLSRPRFGTSGAGIPRV